MEGEQNAPKNIGGRPRKGEFSVEKLLGVCARVALGETLTAISKESGMPSPAQFRAAIYKGGRDLQDAWELAKNERPHSLFEQAIDIARQLEARDWGKEETNTVKAKQIAIDTLRVAASRLAPKEYGERPAGQVVVPVQINTTLSLDPAKPAESRPNLYRIDVPRIEVSKEAPFEPG